MINCLHHFEILTNSSKNLLNYFVNGFKFKLVHAKQTGKYEQFLVSSNSINFLITTLNRDHSSPYILSNVTTSNSYETSLLEIERSDPFLFDLVLDKKNTVFNAAFQVRDLDRILSNCTRHNVKILKDKHVLVNERRYKSDGHVDCAIIKSCVDGVTHTLLDLKNYKGRFLPGYENLKSVESTDTFATHFDHLTYATHKNTSKSLIEWYKNVFNMQYFKINRENDDNNGGLDVRTGSSGMNIKAIKYWLCAETGVQFESKSSLPESEVNSFKFVISEPLDDTEEISEISKDEPKNKNQISIFLEEHNGPGIQHIGFHTPDIFESVRRSKENCNQIKYYATPDTYYQSVGIVFLGY